MNEKNNETTLQDGGTRSRISLTQSLVYTEINEDDVILGRGKRSYNHRGNVSFRKFVQDRALAYKQKNKAYRRALAQEIIKIVERNGGRFLRPIEPPFGSGEEPSQWQAVPASLVLTKVKQALRDTSSRIADDQQPNTLTTTTAAAAAGSSHAAASNLLPSVFHRMNPSSGAILPSFHSQLPTVGPLHPLLLNQPIAQDSEYYSLLGQLASLEQNIQQRQDRERMRQQLQILDQQLLMGQQLPARLPSDLTLTLPQQEALLRRLDYPSIPHQQAQTSTQDLIRELNNRRSLASLDQGLLATMPPQHQREHTRILAPQPIADTMLPGLDPLPHQQLGTAALTTRQHGGLLSGINIPTLNPTDQRVSLGSHFPSSRFWRGNENISSRSVDPIPTAAGTIQTALVPTYRDGLELPLLDDHAGGVVPPPNNGPHHDTALEMFGDDHTNNESPSRADDDMFDNVQDELG